MFHSLCVTCDTAEQKQESGYHLDFISQSVYPSTNSHNQEIHYKFMACRASLFNWQHLSWALSKIIWDFITGVHFAQVITTVACVKIHYTIAESYTYVLPATSFCNVWWNAGKDKQETQSLDLNFPLHLNFILKVENEMAALNAELFFQSAFCCDTKRLKKKYHEHRV